MSKPIPYTTFKQVGEKFIPQYGVAPGFQFESLQIPKLESKNGGMFAHPKYKNAKGQLEDLDIQLPARKAPFGFSAFDSKKTPGEQDMSMAISVDPNDDFGKWCNDYLEAKMIDYVHAHSVEFFKVQHNKETLKALSNGVLRYAQDAVKAANNLPTFKVNVNEKKQKQEDKNKPALSYNPKQYWAGCEDAHGLAKDITTVAPNAVVRLIVRLVNFYIVNGKWGLSWSLQKCIEIQPGGNAAVQADPNMYPDEAIYNAPPPPPPPQQKEPTDQDLFEAAEKAEAELAKKRELEDTNKKGKKEEEEDEEEDEEEEEEAPKKKQKKKTASKKKN